MTGMTPTHSMGTFTDIGSDATATNAVTSDSSTKSQPIINASVAYASGVATKSIESTEKGTRK